MNEELFSTIPTTRESLGTLDSATSAREVERAIKLDPGPDHRAGRAELGQDAKARAALEVGAVADERRVRGGAQTNREGKQGE